MRFANPSHDDTQRYPTRWGSTMILANRLLGFGVFVLGLLATALIVVAMF